MAEEVKPPGTTGLQGWPTWTLDPVRGPHKTKLVVCRLKSLPESSRPEEFAEKWLLAGLMLAPKAVLSRIHKSFTSQIHKGKESFPC